MSQVSISMRKIEEILRLKYEFGLPHRAIATSCGVSVIDIIGIRKLTHATNFAVSPLLLTQSV